MKFHVPFASSPGEAEQTYQAIRRFVAEHNGPLSDDRIAALHYRHNGKNLVATVGKDEPLTREPVIAILRAAYQAGPFYLCTPSRGVVRGDPILASGTGVPTLFDREDLESAT